MGEGLANLIFKTLKWEAEERPSVEEARALVEGAAAGEEVEVSSSG